MINQTLLRIILILTSALIESSLPRISQAQSLAELGDGTYQLCSQPAPETWQQGAGVCLVGVKQHDSFSGYYGYPHSDAFVCLRGSLNGTELTGQGYLISWQSHLRETWPSGSFFWDREARLQLDQGRLVQSNTDDPSVNWAVFQSATLNLQSFYLYRGRQMTSPQQLCDWNFEQERELEMLN